MDRPQVLLSDLEPFFRAPLGLPTCTTELAYGSQTVRRQKPLPASHIQGHQICRVASLEKLTGLRLLHHNSHISVAYLVSESQSVEHHWMRPGSGVTSCETLA